MLVPVRRCILIALLCLVCSGLFCLEPLPACNPFIMGANGLTTLTDDASATSINPAAGENSISTSTSFLHGMSALNQYELASVFGYRNNSFSAAWQTLDNDDYQRQDFRLGIRYELWKVRFGFGYKFFFDDIPGYGSGKDNRLQEGIRFKHNNTTADLAFEHKMPPFRSQNSSAQILNLCLGQKLDDSSELAFGLTAPRNLPVSYKLGCRFQILKNFSALASWSSQPGRFGFATDFRIKYFSLAYALQTHPELSWTHSIGISATLP
jgi:hypothetical protein